MYFQTPLSQPLPLACALLLAGLLAPLANAAPKPLADAEMSAVRGADGTILAGIQSSASANPFANGLSAAFSSSTGATLLTPAEFAASLESVGLSLDSMPDYHGEPVAQTVVDAKPVSFTFTLSDVLRSATGLQYNTGGASFGTLTMTNFDARGTTLWVWQHH
jgi:hypothetical protein